MNRPASPQLHAVIGDLVGSREQASRAEAQQHLTAALAVANEMVEAEQPLEPTIGDELQGVYADLPSAMLATVLVRLALPESMDCRFGIGVGDLEIVGESNYGLTQDGPAWWSARQAVDTAKDRSRQIPGLRTWIVRDDTTEAPDMAQAYLLVRDDLVSGFDGRQRRIALGQLRGRTVTQLAADEGISPSAVSQRHRAGVGALLESIAQASGGAA